jgi:hypothetical protein
MEEGVATARGWAAGPGEASGPAWKSPVRCGDGGRSASAEPWPLGHGPGLLKPLNRWKVLRAPGRAFAPRTGPAARVATSHVASNLENWRCCAAGVGGAQEPGRGGCRPSGTSACARHAGPLRVVTPRDRFLHTKRCTACAVHCITQSPWHAVVGHQDCECGPDDHRSGRVVRLACRPRDFCMPRGQLGPVTVATPYCLCMQM